MPTTHRIAQNAMRSMFFLTWTDWITNGKPVDIRNSAGDREPQPDLIDREGGKFYVPEIAWQNVERTNPNDHSKHWCRFVTDVVKTGQTGFRTHDPEISDRRARYTENGIILIQMFFAKSAFALDIDRELSAIARDIFRPRNLPGNLIWYQNADIRYLKPEERYFRSNVIAEYEFDEHV